MAPAPRAGEPSSVLALRFQARALAAAPSHQSPGAAAASAASAARWLVGTASPREPNELDAVDYCAIPSSAQDDPLRCAASWAHPAEVWAVAPHPSEFARSGLVATAWQAAATPQHCRLGGAGAAGSEDAARAARPGWGVTVWRAPALDAGAASRTAALTRACDLERDEGGGAGAGAAVAVRAVAWSPHAEDEVLTADADGALRTWRLGDGGVARVQTTMSSSPCGAVGGGELWAAEPHPTQAGVAAAATDAGVIVWDARAGALVGSFGCPESSSSSSSCASCGLARWRAAARCVSWAPAGGWRLASAGDDGRLRFWDLRALSASSEQLPRGRPRCAPLQTLGGAHGHAVAALAHHSQHEALLASAGSDGVAALWHAPRVAAGEVAGADDDVGGGLTDDGLATNKEQDGRVWSFDDPAAGGDDALRGVAWAHAAAGGGGGADAWALAVLAHDGRVAVHHVPRSVRYAVLV